MIEDCWWSGYQWSFVAMHIQRCLLNRNIQWNYLYAYMYMYLFCIISMIKHLLSVTFIITNHLGILARNLPESSKILQCTFGNMPYRQNAPMHFRWSFIFSTYGLYFLPGSNFSTFEEVKMPVSYSADFFSKKVTLWGFWEDLRWSGLLHMYTNKVCLEVF